MPSLPNISLAFLYVGIVPTIAVSAAFSAGGTSPNSAAFNIDSINLAVFVGPPPAIWIAPPSLWPALKSLSSI